MSITALKTASFLVRWGSIAGMVFAVYLFVNNAQFWVRASTAKGIVSSEAGSTSSTISGGRRVGTSVSYAPVVSFETASGEKFTFLSDIGYVDLLKYDRGEEIPVLYLESNPKSAKINSWFELFVLPVILFCFAGVFWGVGLLIQFLAEGAPKKAE